MAATKPTYTVDQIATYLTHGYWEDTNRAQRSWDVAPGGQITVNITGLNALGQATARQALDSWTAITGIAFVETTASAQLTFDDGQAGAFSSSSVNGNVITSSFINVNSGWSAYGNYYLQTFIHEIGHSLGLGHTGNYNGSANFNDDAEFANDSWQMSIMSYFSQAQNPNTNASYSFLATASMADIVAVHNLYGTPTNIETGNTTYGDGETTGRTGMDLTTWSVTLVDSSGIDTINLSSRTHDQTLNLNAETFSDLNGKIGNFAIARGTVIENAKTGAGADYIIGNGAANTIQSGAGNDLIRGGNAYDTISAGAGNDTVWGDTGKDVISLGSGNDVFNDHAQNNANGRDSVDGGSGNDTLNGDGGNDTLNGNTGNDSIEGGVGNDQINGGNNADTISAGEGNDIVWGGTGTDTIDLGEGNDIFHDAPQNDNNGRDHVSGRAGNDTLNGDGGNDTLSGDNGNDLVFGGVGDDALYGGNGVDTLEGGDGNDEINGGSHADLLTGGAGNDEINGGSHYDTISAGHGNDTVWGGTGQDSIGLGNGHDIFYDDAQNTNDGNDSVKGHGGNDTLLGDGGNDTLDGGVGGDRIQGGIGDDRLTGGAHRDTFVFYAGSDQGTDTITDFVRGTDTLEMNGLSYSDLSFSGTGSGVRVTWDDGSVKLDDISAGAISQDDFLFV